MYYKPSSLATPDELCHISLLDTLCDHISRVRHRKQRGFGTPSFNDMWIAGFSEVTDAR
jgi:predicted nucleic acid-binding protein